MFGIVELVGIGLAEQLASQLEDNFLTLQWEPLNVISLGHTKSDIINRIITMSYEIYLLMFGKWDLAV